MTDIRYPTPTRRFMSEVAGVRRYHRNAARAVAAARGGTLWVALGKGWSCNPDRVAAVTVAVAAATAITTTGRGRP
jgi:hypothetical protein